jgi:hypothetical protein
MTGPNLLIKPELLSLQNAAKLCITGQESNNTLLSLLMCNHAHSQAKQPQMHAASRPAKQASSSWTHAVAAQHMAQCRVQYTGGCAALCSSLTE